jgi:hypothetical protein
MSTLLNIQYTFTNNDTSESLTLSDGTDTSEIALIHTVPVGLHGATLRQTEEPLSYRDGVITSDLYLGAKVITWEIIMIADTESKMNDLVDTIRRVFVPPVERGLNKTLHRMTFTDIDGYTKYLDYEIETLPQFSKTVGNQIRMDCVFTIKASNPRYYGSNLLSYTLTSSEIIGGMQVESQVPSQVATILDYNGHTITNLGTYKASPNLTIMGVLVNPVFYNTTTGQALRYNTTLGIGDVIYCNCTTGETTRNGSDNSDELADNTTFIDLIPGNNNLIFTDDLLSASGQCTYEFRHTWL